MEAAFENGESAKKRISESQNHLRGKGNANFRLLSDPRPGMMNFHNSMGNFFCGFLQAGATCLQKTFILFSPPNGTGAVGRGQGAVSYTHLRAHETVLDVVCRLMLEKNNKNTIINEHTAHP